jgi:enolase
MTTDELRENMRGQIADLRAQREASTDDEEKKAANEAIEAIESTIRQINIDAANQVGGNIDALIKDLDAVLDKYQLDAVSALGRTIKKVRTELSRK